VADNREARIQVGQQVPIATSETIASVGVPAQQTFQYKDIGIILKVKPQVNESGLVSLEIDQEVSNFSTQQLFSDSTQVIINKVEATTQLVVSNGETIVIGGLIREDANKTASGIPFLNKIPILGYLFGQRSKDTTRTELIILLTPRVLHNQEQARGVSDTIIDRFSEQGGSIKREDLLSGGLKSGKKSTEGTK
jgi:general secretion pathway protein D